MSWDFETEPEFQAQLDWMDGFVRHEVEPVDHLISHGYDMTDPARQRLIPPLQQKVRERGLWACHLGPEPRRPRLRAAETRPDERDTRTLALGPRSSSAAMRPDSGNAEILAHYGTPELKQRYLEPLLRNDIVSAFSMTEPRGRLRPDRLRDHRHAGRRRVGDQRREVVLLARAVRRVPDRARGHRAATQRRRTAGCRCSSCRGDTPGVEIIRNVGMYGHAGEGTHAYMRYNDVRIPADHILGGRGEGFAVAQTRLGGGRIHHAMRTVGLVRKAFDAMCERALSRRTQGEELARKQLVQQMIADSWIQLEQFRLLVLRTAWKIDRYNDYRKVRADISAVKAAMPQVLHDVAARALQIHGSLGASEEMPFGAMIMESFHMGLVDGATEVHKITLARELLKGYKPASGLFPATHLPRLAAEARSRYHDVLAELHSEEV